jgi:hypothetical protein
MARWQGGKEARRQSGKEARRQGGKVARWQGGKGKEGQTSILLRTGRVSVMIRRFVHHSWYRPAGERLSSAGTSYIARDRYETERVFLCL